MRGGEGGEEEGEEWDCREGRGGEESGGRGRIEGEGGRGGRGKWEEV